MILIVTFAVGDAMRLDMNDRKRGPWLIGYSRRFGQVVVGEQLKSRFNNPGSTPLGTITWIYDVLI